MPHVIYENFVLESQIAEQLDSALNLESFCSNDDSLVGTPGMTKVINRYEAVDATEDVAMGEGNEGAIVVTYDDTNYRVKTAQNRFEYYDEQAMTDPMVVEVGMRQLGSGLYNWTNAEIYAEWLKTTNKQGGVSKFDFDFFVDAVASLTLQLEEDEKMDKDIEIFAIVHKKDVASIRKELKETLQYIEAYARNGYIGSVAGVNIYQKADAVEGALVVATKRAVTRFIKKGVEVEQPPRSSEDANIRKNTVIARKYYVVALTDARQVFVGTKLSITPTSSTFDKKAETTDNKDLAFTLAGGTFTLGDVYIGESKLTPTTHYTVTGGVVTILKARLATLEVGTSVLTIKTNKVDMLADIVVIQTP